MLKKIIFLALLTIANFLATAQPPITALNNWVTAQPIQKLHLHLDRENYLAGDAAHFKAYLINDFLLDTTNTTMYVELLDGKNVITKVVLPVLYSAAMGSITLPDTLTTGNYTIRAYSKGMLPQKEDYFFYQKIFVSGIVQKQQAISIDTIQLAFFPEGGNIVQALTGSVAFKATNQYGVPIDVEGNLYNSKNEQLAPISCLHSGMGLFDFTPTQGETYYVTLKNDVAKKKYDLPNTQPKGIALSIYADANGTTYQIKQQLGDAAFEAAYMVGQIQQHITFKKEFAVQQASTSGMIDTKNLPSGIMQITVFNKANMPLAERLIFINNNDYLVEADVKADTFKITPGGKNKFFITLKDTVQGQLSVSITDPAFNTNVLRQQNIVSNLLLTSDLTGYIHNPAFYLSSMEDSVKNALDLLMMINGWRRFNWQAIPTPTINKKPTSGFITLKGEATIEGTKKPFANKQMMVMINSLTSGNKKTIQLIETDNIGEFKLDSLIFFGKNKIFFSDVKGKRSTAIDVQLSNDTLFASSGIPQKPWLRYKNELLSNSNALQNAYTDMQKSKGLLLNTVVVKTTKKSPLQVVEEKYTKGMFSGFANKTIDLVNNDDAQNFINIFDYIQTKVGGLTVVNVDMDYALYIRQAAAMEGSTAMKIFLDEVETPASFIANIPPAQIGLIKVYNTFLGGVGNSEGGAMAIYTKKTEDYKTLYQLPNLKMYNGYSITKEFFAPNYKLSTLGVETDNRLTLDWRPQIFVNNINPKIPISFYNNSRTQSFKVVVEGVTNTGKLIWLEKVISN